MDLIRSQSSDITMVDTATKKPTDYPKVGKKMLLVPFHPNSQLKLSPLDKLLGK
jgi:hypothetical protein